MIHIIALFLLAYLLGSIPFSFWLGKLFFNIDVRKSGSKSSGATNVLRVIGAKLAIPILILDILKGLGATWLVHIFFQESDPNFIYFKLIAGLLAMIGHIFPVFAQFKGGKGIATMTGVLIGTIPQVLIYAFPVFIVFVAVTRYVSVGSLVGSLSIPFLLYFVTNPQDKTLAVFSFIVFLIVLFTHRANVKRLIQGNENKLSFRKKS
jgi:glycerol-3-phosphate acyltransferase PlsY